MIRVGVACTEDAYAACLRIRHAVFIVEQGVPFEEEVDHLERECTHFLAVAETTGEPCGTARLWITPEGHAKAQRVAVMASHRGKGVGEALMRALEAEALRQGCTHVVLGAQVSAVRFYQRLGYETYGDAFMEAGIEHRMMRRVLLP